MSIFPGILVALTTYAVGAASPGPGNMTVMMTAMRSGRRAGLATAFGVASGSISWGILAAIGLGAVMRTYASALYVLKIVGGIYLLWLAFNAAREALRRETSRPLTPDAASPAIGMWGQFAKGYWVHMTNPKAIIVWMATISLGLPTGADPLAGFVIVSACAVLGVTIFSAYALAFSTQTIATFYERKRRRISGFMALFYGAIGTRLILSR